MSLEGGDGFPVESGECGRARGIYRLSSDSRKFLVCCSFLEIYNELLVDKTEGSRVLGLILGLYKVILRLYIQLEI